MVTGEGELYQVKDKQKRKNPAVYLEDKRIPGKKLKARGFSTWRDSRRLFSFCVKICEKFGRS